MNADDLFTLLHLLAAFWYVMGLTAVQLPLVKGIQSDDWSVKGDGFAEASHYQGVMLVPGAIGSVATGVFLWAQLDYGLVSTGWLVLLEALYAITLLGFLPLVGVGLRRGRIAALKARRSERPTADVEAALNDTVPLVFAGLALLLVPAMAYLSVFRPF